MRILRFLKKPIKLLMFLLMISALIYFRSVIFHPNVDKYMDNAVTYIETRLDIAIPSYVNDDKNIVAETKVECPPVAEADVIDSDDLTEVLPSELVNDEVTVNDQEPVNTSTTSDEKSDLVESLLIAIEAVNKKVDKLAQAREVVPVMDHTPAIERNPEALVTDKDEQVSAGNALAVAAHNDIVKKDNVNEDGKEMLLLARQSFWKGNLSEAESLYQKLIAIDGTDPDVHGEIGNIYYTQGKWKQAGQAYYQAAIRLLAQQNDAQTSNQISYLLRVIQGLDTESAEKLRIKISE